MRQGTSRIQPWLSVGLVLAALLCCGAAWAGQVNAVGLEQGATGTRAEIQLQGAGQYRTLSLTAPHRLVVDLPDSQAARGMRLPAPAGVVTSVRTGQPVPGTLRIVFELAAPVAALPQGDKAFERWLERNVAAHKNPLLRAVSLSFKRPGAAPGDASADVMDAAAALADQFSASELRVTHQQNLLLPWVHVNDLPALYLEAKRLGLAQSNIGLLSDMIVCPGGDFCSLANARSLPIAQALTERYQDMDELHDLGPIHLNMSGCINSCGHHHSGHIGILGVDKDGKEWYQVTLGGADGSAVSGPALPGKVVGPSFLAAEVPDVIEAVLDTYRSLRQSTGQRSETFIETLRRTGIDPFKVAANAARHAVPATAEAV